MPPTLRGKGIGPHHPKEGKSFSRKPRHETKAASGDRLKALCPATGLPPCGLYPNAADWAAERQRRLGIGTRVPAQSGPWGRMSGLQTADLVVSTHVGKGPLLGPQFQKQGSASVP